MASFSTDSAYESAVTFVRTSPAFARACASYPDASTSSASYVLVIFLGTYHVSRNMAPHWLLEDTRVDPRTTEALQYLSGKLVIEDDDIPQANKMRSQLEDGIMSLCDHGHAFFSLTPVVECPSISRVYMLSM